MPWWCFLLDRGVGRVTYWFSAVSPVLQIENQNLITSGSLFCFQHCSVPLHVVHKTKKPRLPAWFSAWSWSRAGCLLVFHSESSPANRKPRCYHIWFFILLSTLQRAAPRCPQNKETMPTGMAFCLIVESGGFEPPSKRATSSLSTCLVII